MKKNSLLVSILAVATVGLTLTGCANNQASTANADSTPAAKTAKKATVKAESKKQSSAQSSSAKEVAEAVTTNTHPTEKTANTQTQPQTHTQTQVAVTTKKATTQPSADFLLKQRLVDSAMAYVAGKTDQTAMPNGYWAFAKAVWGVSDSQILTPLGGDSYQVFSQGEQRYVLTIGATTATLVAHSDYDNTTMTITLDKNSAAIISVE